MVWCFDVYDVRERSEMTRRGLEIIAWGCERNGFSLERRTLGIVCLEQREDVIRRSRQ